MERLPDMIKSVSPVTVNIEWVPILLGGLFKDIGSPMVCCYFTDGVRAFLCCPPT